MLLTKHEWITQLINSKIFHYHEKLCVSLLIIIWERVSFKIVNYRKITLEWGYSKLSSKLSRWKATVYFFVFLLFYFCFRFLFIPWCPCLSINVRARVKSFSHSYSRSHGGKNLKTLTRARTFNFLRQGENQDTEVSKNLRFNWATLICNVL